MIQELLSGERKISITSEGFLQATSSSSPPCTTTTTTTNTNATPNAPSNNPADSTTQQNLRCPRCDSTNTKFCYYNNYNLTQPRHFCKTCRRYWTKGGALRNVPIGGGCRKNKISTPPPKSSSAYAKLRTSLSSLSSDFGKQSFHLETGFDHDLSSSNHAILWPSPPPPPPPQNSHILALLRASQNPNPNNPSGPQFSMAPSPPLWRTSQQLPGGFGEAQHNSGIQELFQRLKSSRAGGGGLYYGTTHQPVSLTGNVMSSSSSNSNNIGVGVLESVPATGGEFSYLNSPFSWSDVATPSAGAYP